MKIFSEELVERAVSELHIADLSQATIGDVLLVAQYLEKETGIPFIRMDQGSPGLPANQIGIEAEKAALDRGVGSQYPAAAGVAELKNEASRFVKAFMNVEISPRAWLQVRLVRLLLVRSAFPEKIKYCLSIPDFRFRNPSFAL